MIKCVGPVQVNVLNRVFLDGLLEFCIRIRIADSHCELGIYTVLPLSRCESQPFCGLYDSQRYTNDDFVSSGSNIAAGIAQDLEER